jgi:hypothetical protein
MVFFGAVRIWPTTPGSLRAIFNPNYPPDGNVLQGGAQRVPPRGSVR